MARKSVDTAEVKAAAEGAEVLAEEPKKAAKKATARKTTAKTAAKKEGKAAEAAAEAGAEALAAQEEAPAKKAAVKKTAARKTAAKKEEKAAEPAVSVIFEYGNKQIVAKELLAKSMEAFRAAHAEVEIQEMQLYVNADEGCAYIVVNGVEYPEDRILFD